MKYVKWLSRMLEKPSLFEAVGGPKDPSSRIEEL